MRRTIIFVVILIIATANMVVFASGLKIPEITVLDSISNIYEPVRFDHATHSMIAERCVVCHHEHPSNADLCKNCHGLDDSIFKKSLSSTFMNCDNCHGKYDPSNPGMPGLKVAYHRKCFQCHKGMGMIGEDPKGCTQICHARKIKSE
ncbi:MAG: cytochrome c3 family protein [Nitrospirae bacterium]|nr:cytochrome c3 family protein [Nitrospirota bacterium]